MRFHIVTLFPEFFASALATTMLKKGQERGAVEFCFYNVRDYAPDKHRMTDDTPYGGGPGMVMKPEPLIAAIEATGVAADRPRRVLLSPQGTTFTQERAHALATLPAVALICGRYEGVDERIRLFVDEELSVGDFVLSGGEAAALAVIDAVARLVPGVLGSAASTEEESFRNHLLEAPQFTRPPEFRGLRVPEIRGLSNRLEVFNAGSVKISASGLRASLRRGETAADSVPGPVAEYITKHGLYRSPAAAR